MNVYASVYVNTSICVNTNVYAINMYIKKWIKQTINLYPVFLHNRIGNLAE